MAGRGPRAVQPTVEAGDPWNDRFVPLCGAAGTLTHLSPPIPPPLSSLTAAAAADDGGGGG